MNWLDKAISYVSPTTALERHKSRLLLNSIKGGLPTRTSEYWPTSQGLRFGNAQDRYALGSARDRAYQAFRNNPVARTLVQTETDNVIGDGLNYQPNSSSPEWNREAEDRYYQWLDFASVRGPDIHSGCDLQRLLWEKSRVGGDVGWLLVARGAESRIQIVPAENIATPDGMFADRSIYDGIRFDAQGAPTQYFVLSVDEFGKRSFTTVAARDFVFFAPVMDTNSARGETCYLTIFDLLAHLDRYVDGVSLAAWMATVFGIIFKTNSGPNQLSLMNTVPDSQGADKKAITFENGMVKYVGTDEEVAQVQASQPMNQTPEFIRTMYRMLGQPFDMPLEVIAKDMSTCNFSSARIGLLPFYRSCRIKAAKFGARWSRTIRWWLSRERQRVDGDPLKWKTAFPPDFFQHELLVNAWDYTDPLTEPQSDLLQYNMKTKSMQMIIAERGRDAEKILREIEEWQKKTADMPEALSTYTRDPAPEPTAPAQDTPAVEDKTNANQ